MYIIHKIIEIMIDRMFISEIHWFPAIICDKRSWVDMAYTEQAKLQNMAKNYIPLYRFINQ